ncbi:hypothetical protein L1887_32233 [Cichorium endivia]|nr:hypothetical protein L1887_32233 [Cichorium endivia]
MKHAPGNPIRRMALSQQIGTQTKRVKPKTSTFDLNHEESRLQKVEASVGGGHVGWDEEEGETEEQTIAASPMAVGGGLLCEFQSRGEAAGDSRRKNVLTTARAWR